MGRDDKPTRPPAEDDGLARRLKALDRKLDAERMAQPPDRDMEPGGRPGMAMALRLGADFVAGVVVGAALGWGIDRLFGTTPWGLVVFLMLGFAAGVLSVLRTAGLVRPGPPGPDDRL
jgi:ATP synthase protein I